MLRESGCDMLKPHCFSKSGKILMDLDLTIDCIDNVTRIGNAHAHNWVHSMLRLGSQLLVVPLTFL